MKKLLSLLKTFSRQDFLEFSHFLDHPTLAAVCGGPVPSVRTRSAFKQFVLAPLADAAWPSDLDRWYAALWQALFSNRPFDIRRLTLWASPFNKVVLVYFERHARLHIQGNSDLYLFEELHRRKLISLIDKEDLVRLMDADGLSFLTVVALEDRYRAHLLAYNLGLSELQLLHLDESFPVLIHGALKSTQQLLVLRSLRWKAAALNLHRFDVVPLVDMFEEGKSEGKTEEGARDGMITAYRSLIGVLESGENSIPSWYELVDTLHSTGFPIQSDEGMELLRFAYNLGVRLANAEGVPGKISYRLFELYRFGYAQNLLAFEGVILSQNYYNLCFYALQAGEVEFASSSTVELAPRLDLQGLEEGALHLNLTLIAMAKEEWGKAWAALQRYSPRDTRRIRKYVLEIKVLFETDHEHMLHRIHTFLMFLTKESLGYDKQRMEWEKKRALLVKRLAETGLYSYAKQRRLWQQICECPIDRSWLVRKFEARFGPPNDAWLEKD